MLFLPQRLNWPIDLVYTWVNGDDPAYQQECRKYAKRPKELNPERYRDNLDLLKYSLRSVEKNLKWIRNIYIVTARPQIPCWLNRNHSQIKVVHHDQFVDNSYLPTFSSNAIELQLHKIRDLSEQFIYMCDDFLLGRKVNPDDFISWRGKTKIAPRRTGNIHIPHLVSKAIMAKTILKERKYYDEVMVQKFRKTTRFPIDMVYADSLVENGLHSYYSRWFICRHKQELEIGRQPLVESQNVLRRMLRQRPKFIAFSDNMGHKPDLRYVEMVSEFLRTMFPEKSQFELAGK